MLLYSGKMEGAVPIGCVNARSCNSFVAFLTKLYDSYLTKCSKKMKIRVNLGRWSCNCSRHYSSDHCLVSVGIIFVPNLCLLE